MIFAKRTPIRAVVLGVMTALALARSFAGDLGMPAPALKISQWAKGGAVDLAAGKGTNIFVVEFWATWCGPCRQTIPQLTQYQKKYKDRGLVIVGISTEAATKVLPFVAKQGETMDYVVAVDDVEQTARAYMGEFGVQGIPHAFVVDKQGRIVWHGHPLDGLDQVLQAVVEGRYDVEMVKRASLVRVTIQSYFRTLTTAGDAAAAREIGEQVLKEAADIPALLDQFAWVILTDARVKPKDIALAKQGATLAFRQTGGTNASVAETYARALFESGMIKEAVETQRKAISATSLEAERRHFEKTLREYEGKLAQ